MTTEGIRGYGDAAPADSYHPVQERIADCNGTQCGFCTPGHVMAMYSLLRENTGPLAIPEIEERFDGTICRCTGYRSIMKACHSFAAEGMPGDETSSKIAVSQRPLICFTRPTWLPVYVSPVAKGLKCERESVLLACRVTLQRSGRPTTRRRS